MCSVLDVRLLFLRDWPGKSESKKLEMRSLGPPLPETIQWSAGRSSFKYFGQRVKRWYSSVIMAKTEPGVSHLSNMPVCEQSVYS